MPVWISVFEAANRFVQERRSSRLPSVYCGILIASAILMIGGCSAGEESAKAKKAKPKNDVGKLVSSEETILKLAPKLKLLNQAAMNLRLPLGEAKKLFKDSFQANDLSGQFSTKTVNSYVEFQSWAVSPDETSSAELWQPFFDSVKYFERAKFYFVNGRFDSTLENFHAKLGFTGVARLKDDRIASVSGKIETDWSSVDGSPSQLRISNWRTKKFQCTIAAAKMFQDMSHQLVADPQLAKQLKGSHHVEVVKRAITGKGFRIRVNDPYPRVFSEVTLEHPGVSIVDINQDGLSDFFLARPMQSSLFFLNKGDGSFSEVSKEMGLSIEGGFDGGCTCALFADYDNDGDLDVFIGRARHGMKYLENIDNKVFKDETKTKLRFTPPYMVSSLAAADYNNDGLLDLYVSTYSPNEGSMGEVPQPTWPNVFLNRRDSSKYHRLRAKAHLYLDMVGPPNLLLENRGGKFMIAPSSPSVECWRKTFQAAWADYDNDGDQDLYVCNDFSPDDFFRNDGDQGFTRVNDEVGLNKLGFGMGVSWGDHNQDGTLDLYVSNMFSKAGTRITAQIEGVDPRMKDLAKGNYLYQLIDGKFSLVSDVGGQHETVAHAGWSWGSQFCDIDNDGALDIFAASGYYTAPAEFAEDVDL